MSEKVTVSMQPKHRKFYKQSGISPSAVLQHYAEQHNYMFCPHCDTIIGLDEISGHPINGIVHNECGHNIKSSKEPLTE